MNSSLRLAYRPLAVIGFLLVSTSLLLAQGEPAKPGGTQEEVAGENALNHLLKVAEEKRLTYSPDKRLLAHLDGHKVTIWSVEERRRLHQFVVDGRPLAAAFSPDGGSLVTADGEGNLEYRSTIKLWSLAKGESRLISQFLGIPTHFSFSPDGSRLAAASNLNFIGSITRNPEGGITPDRIQTGGNIHVWRVSDGSELLKVDIELPEYTAKLMEFQRAGGADPDRKNATDPLVAAYQEAVRKRVPYRLNFSPDGQRLNAVSQSGQEAIFDSTTGKLLRPASRGDQDSDDHAGIDLKLKSEEVTRQPYMDELPDEVSAMAGLWRVDAEFDRLLGAAKDNRYPSSLRFSFAVPGAPVLPKEAISLIDDLFVKKMKHTIVAVGSWEAEKDSRLTADRDSNCFVTTKNGSTYIWFGTPDESLVGSKVSHVWAGTRKQLLILDGNWRLPPRMRKAENLRAYLQTDLNVRALRPFDSKVSDSAPPPKLDIDAAHEWARKTLEKSRSSFPPNWRGNTSLPLARPITSLHLSNVSLTDAELRNLAAFPKLKSLTLSGKGITDEGLKNLLTLKNLNMLSLRGTKITDVGMRHIAKLRNLNRLDLSGAKFTDATLLALADLPKLRELALERTPITDEGLRHVRKMKELRKLSLRRTKISNDGLRHLAMMPSLREIILQSTPVTSEGLHHLAACESLRTISCWGTDVTSEDIRRLKEVLPQCEIDKTLIE